MATKKQIEQEHQAEVKRLESKINELENHMITLVQTGELINSSPPQAIGHEWSVSAWRSNHLDFSHTGVNMIFDDQSQYGQLDEAAKEMQENVVKCLKKTVYTIGQNVVNLAAIKAEGHIGDHAQEELDESLVVNASAVRVYKAVAETAAIIQRRHTAGN
jgi:hypothetical protein